MTEVSPTTRKCSVCGSEKQDQYCSQCGKDTLSDLFVSVSETITIRTALKGKVREGEKGEVKPHHEFSEKDVESGDPRLPKGVHISLSMDRRNDRYRQVVTDKNTGEVLHAEDEPLSQHVAKRDKKK